MPAKDSLVKKQQLIQVQIALARRATVMAGHTALTTVQKGTTVKTEVAIRSSRTQQCQ